MSSTVQMNRPNRIVIDIWGVITPYNFKDDLKLYAKQNITDYIEKNWNNNQIKDFINKLREQTVEDKQINPDLPSIVVSDENNKSHVIQSVIDCINWRESNSLKTHLKTINDLYQLIWSEGYRTGRLIVRVFDDVLPSFIKWNSEKLGIKIYTFASGLAEEQKLFLSSTSAGNLNHYITSYLQSFGKKEDPKKFRQMMLGLVSDGNWKSILYITDTQKKAEAAKNVECRSVVVLRPGDYTDQSVNGLELITSLNDLDFIIS